MNYTHFIGIDVSKSWLDFSLIKEGKLIEHKQIINSIKDVNSVLGYFRKNYKAGGKKTLFCLENTGLYMEPVVAALSKKKLAVWVESPLQIKLSLGIKRGKNDKVDSLRIAQYAFTHKDGVRLWKHLSTDLQKLKLLRTLRLRLIRAGKGLQVPLTEMEVSVNKSGKAELYTYCKKSIISLKEDIAAVDKSISVLIKENEHLHKLHEYITSIPGIGPVVALELIITTNEFTQFSCPKKFASYAGIAPFKHTSGSSIKGKAKVSLRGNKRMKTLLHMAAIAAVKAKGELKEYYQRRKMEGHHPMSILNAIRNKLVSRVFACVKEERPYQKDRSQKCNLLASVVVCPK